MLILDVDISHILSHATGADGSLNSVFNKLGGVLRCISGNHENTMFLLCLTIAAAIAYRDRSGDELQSVQIAARDKTFYAENLKPILEFLIFIKTYFPHKCASPETISLWCTRTTLSVKKMKIKVNTVSTAFQDREIDIDSARKNVTESVHQYEEVIHLFCEGLIRGTIQLSG